jgi:hypothetical protein
MSDRYIRSRNHMYLAEADRTVRNGIVNFAGYMFTSESLHKLNGKRIRVLFDRAIGVLYQVDPLSARCYRPSYIRPLRRLLNPPKSENLPIWEFDKWMPILPKKGRRAS